MAKHVIILGAGASVLYGAPVMNNFLDVARTIASSGGAGNKKENYERVFLAIGKLQRVHSKTQLDLRNIESIYTVFEMARLLGVFPDRKDEDLDILIEDLVWLIVSTIEATVEYPYNPHVNSPYACLPNFLKDLCSRERQDRYGDVAIVTFNYDVVIESAAHYVDAVLDYGFGDRVRVDHTLPLLKLHGSINWSERADKSGIECASVSKSIQNLGTYRPAPQGGLRPNEKFRLNIGSEIGKTKRIGSVEVVGTPAIIPPSWDKGVVQKSIRPVWERAAVELSEAQSIYVVGYSLPSTDMFFRNLLALGTVSNTPLQRFMVFNPDESRHEAFRSFLGPGVLDRYRPSEDKFDAAIRTIHEMILRD